MRLISNCHPERSEGPTGILGFRRSYIYEKTK